MKKVFFVCLLGLAILSAILLFREKAEKAPFDLQPTFLVSLPEISSHPPSPTVVTLPTRKYIKVPLLCQYPTLPTGCEATAAAMVLQYYEEKITAEEFAGGWLTCSTDFYLYDDCFYGPDPYAVFAGDPFSRFSYGCFAFPIVQAINANSTVCRAEILPKTTLEDLCHTYIDQNKPLLIWATMDMRAAEEGKQWYLPDESLFTWIAGEHCLVLIGYDEKNYFLNDPQTGDTVSYPKSVVQKRFAELGQQAVYIYPQK